MSSLRMQLKNMLAPIWSVAAMEAVLYILMFASMTLRFRYLHAELVGFVAYVTALSDIPGAFYSHFNRALGRFLPTCPKEDRIRIFSVSLSVQMVIAAVFLACFLLGEIFPRGLAFWERRIQEGPAASFFRIFIVAYFATSLLNRLILSYERGMGRVLAAQKWDALNSLLNVASTLTAVAIFRDRVSGLKLMLGTQVAITGTLSMLLWIKAARRGEITPRGVMFCLANWKSECRPIFARHFARYTLPLQAASVFAYVKENAAVLLLGQFNFLDSAGIYQLASRLYVVPRKFIPGLVDKMLPKMVALANRNKGEFIRKYNSFSWAQFAAYVLTGSVILFAVPFVKWLYHVREPGLGAIFYLFSLNLVLSAISQVNINIIMLGEETRNFMYASIVRSIVVVAATAFFIREFKTLGATLGLVISSLIVTILLAWETRRSDLFNWSLNWKQGACLLAVGLCWLFPLLVFRGAYL